MVSDSFRSTAGDRAGPRASPWGAAYDGLIRRRAYGLRLAAAPFAFPLLQALVRGAAGDVVALLGAGALLLWAGRAVDRGLLAGEGSPSRSVSPASRCRHVSPARSRPGWPPS